MGLIVLAVELKAWKRVMPAWNGSARQSIPTMLLTPFEIYRVIFTIELR